MLPATVTNAQIHAPDGQYAPNEPFRQKGLVLTIGDEDVRLSSTAFGIGQYPIEYIVPWKDGKASPWNPVEES